MMRALILWLGLALPAAAQTPVATNAANDLRACLLSAQGFRDAARLAQLDLSIDRIRGSKWGTLTELAPGVFHLSRAGTDRTIEIKLPDASGAAHCMLFGPSLSSGQGALTADKFVELNFMTGLTQAPAPQGMSRRYTITGAPYNADLVAYSAAGGDVVGFVFSGVPQGQTTRALSAGDPTVSSQSVGTALSNAVDLCLRNYFSRETLEAAISAHGFEFAFSTGGSAPKDIYFTGDNAVSVHVSPGTCSVETNYMGPGEAARIAGTVLDRTAPGIFRYHVERYDGCPSYYQEGRLDPPVFLNIKNMKRTGNTGCVEDGTARINVDVAG